MKVIPSTTQRYLGTIKDGTQRAAAFPGSWAQQFTPFSTVKTNTNCCAVVNGIPKSGTHLVKSLLNYLGRWEALPVHINRSNWEVILPDQTRIRRQAFHPFLVKRLRNGQLLAGHLPWSRALAKSFADVTPTRRLKHVFIYRDPRDTFVSRLTHVAYLPSTVVVPGVIEQREFFMEHFSDDDERLAHVISNVADGSFFLDFEPWLDNPDCMPVKFEELYPEVLALKENIIGPVVRGILDYVEFDAGSFDAVDCYENVNGKSITATSEVNKVGQYKRAFTDRHYTQIDTPAFRNVLDAFGYEW